MNNNIKGTAEKYQPLFDLMHDEHGVILLESEMDDIIYASQKVVDNFKKEDEK